MAPLLSDCGKQGPKEHGVVVVVGNKILRSRVFMPSHALIFSTCTSLSASYFTLSPYVSTALKAWESLRIRLRDPQESISLQWPGMDKTGALIGLKRIVEQDRCGDNCWVWRRENGGPLNPKETEAI